MNTFLFYPSNPALKPGALLAVPAALSLSVGERIRTLLGKKMLAVLTDYGEYLDDDTASNSAAYNVEGGVNAECNAACGSPNVLAPAPGNSYYHDLVAIFQALHVVNNNSPKAKGGGGVPRRPPAPPICTTV
jgi:hypothetical protein